MAKHDHEVCTIPSVAHHTHPNGRSDLEKQICASPREIVEFCTGIADVTKMPSAMKDPEIAVLTLDDRYVMLGERLHAGWFVAAVKGDGRGEFSVNWELNGAITFEDSHRT